MAISVFSLTLLIVVPSVISAAMFSLGKIPLRLSLQQTNLPVQLFFLGLLIPALPYVLAYVVTSYTWSMCWTTPLFAAVGLLDDVLTIERIRSGAVKWTLFFVSFYLLCVAMSGVVILVLRRYPKLMDACERLGMMDDQKVAEAWGDQVLTEVDIVSNHGQYIYSGWLKSGRNSFFFDGGGIVLRKVRRTKIEDGDKPIEKTQNQSEETLLGEMYFPKKNIVNINLRTETKMKFENIRWPD